MIKKGWVKRLLPFLATFVIGIFIASFFVDLSRPRIGFRGPGRRWQEMQRVRIENEELRNENLRLKNELESVHHDMDFPSDLDREAFQMDGLSVPPPPIPNEVPHPPIPQRFRK
jgi:hypothetical protein